MSNCILSCIHSIDDFYVILRSDFDALNNLIKHTEEFDTRNGKKFEPDDRCDPPYMFDANIHRRVVIEDKSLTYCAAMPWTLAVGKSDF